VRRRVRGREHVCRLRVQPLDQVAQWARTCRELWEQNFARLDVLLEGLQGQPPAQPSPATPRRHRPREGA
jgi:hypothetical protein